MVDVGLVTIPKKNCGTLDPGLQTVQYAKPVPTELANFTARRFDLSKRSTGLLNMTCKEKGCSLPVQFKRQNADMSLCCSLLNCVIVGCSWDPR